MLSLFPQLLFLRMFAPLLIRASIAILFGYSAWQNVQRNDTVLRVLSILEAGAAIALLAGSWTQVAALVGVIIIAVSLYFPRFRNFPFSTLILALVMTLSLVVTGPGAFAFDLPL